MNIIEQHRRKVVEDLFKWLVWITTGMTRLIQYTVAQILLVWKGIKNDWF